jgi:hypothetical protein
MADSNPTRTELEAQFAFYDGAARRYGYTYQAIRLVNAVSASAAAFTGLLTPWPAVVPGALAAIAAALAIIERAWNPQREWMRTRTAAELLRRERTFYDAGASEYADPSTRQAVLAERMETIRSRELEEYFRAITAESKAPKA